MRPCPLWIVKLGDGTGRFLARFLVLLAPCLTLTGFVAGEAFPGAGRLLGMALSAVLASPLLVASYFMLGASCLWVKQAEPMFWIWQKSMFLFGGLLWPLALYPPAVQKLAWFTPFPAMLAAPAQWGLPGGLGTGGEFTAPDILGRDNPPGHGKGRQGAAAVHPRGRDGMMNLRPLAVLPQRRSCEGEN